MAREKNSPKRGKGKPKPVAGKKRKGEPKKLKLPVLKGKLTLGKKLKKPAVDGKKTESQKHGVEEPKKAGSSVGEKIVQQEIQKELRKGTLRIQTVVKDVMENKYRTISDNKKVGDALEMMLEYSIDVLPVVDKFKKPIGIIEQDYLMKIMEKRNVFDSKEDEFEFHNIVELNVKDVMLKISAIDASENVVDASEKMAKEDLGSLFITDHKGGIVGILTRERSLRAIQSEYFITKAGLSGKIVIKTEIDTFIDLLREKKVIALKDAAKALNVSKDKVEEWAAILEAGEVIEILHPFVGDIKFRWKNGK